MKTKADRTDEASLVRPKYYEVDGALHANANRAWLLAFLTIPIALAAIGFAVLVRMQPPTVIRIGPNGDASVVGKPSKGSVTDLATAGTDQFLDEAFVKRFLTSYQNYSPSDVDDHWAASLNMMTRNLRGYTLKAMADDNTRGKIDDGQIQSVFHLRELDAVSGEPLTYLIYGVKDVHHLSNGTEVTDHFVNEYRIRVIADKRSDTYAGTMQETCLRLMGKKMLVALMLEGKFSGEGLMALDADEDLMSAMARELLEKAGVGESADSIWRSLEKERGQLVPQPPPPIQQESDSLLDLPDFVVANPSSNHDGIHLLEPVRVEIKSTPWPAAAVPVQLSLFG